MAVTLAYMLSRGWVATLLHWLLLLGAVGLSLEAYRAPSMVPATAPPGVFSSERALGYVRGVASQEHPVGSEAHEEARQSVLRSLRAMSLEPEGQDGTGITTVGSIVAASAVSNVLVRVPGRASTEAVLLVAHYDSVSTGPGAGDDGAGVATLLETLRALKSTKPLRNDVIALFTDGEEHGLSGAERYVSAHLQPGPRDLIHEPIGIVLNFDNRGDQGIVNMFETSRSNRWLIDVLAHAPFPFGSSLLYTAYLYLPNNTDFTVFRQAGFSGMNFAMGQNLESYHTRLDTDANLSLKSLQHMGSYALPLCLYLGDVDFHAKQAAGGDAVFFDIWGSVLVHYPASWVIPTEILLSVGLLVLLWASYREQTFRPARVLVAMLLHVVAMAITCVLFWGLVTLVDLLAGQRLLLGDTWSNALLMVGVLLAGGAAGLALHALSRKLVGLQHMSAAGLIVFWLLGLIVSLRLPGASYLFAWPLAWAVISLAIERVVGARWRPWVVWLGSVPAVVLFAPFLYLLFIFLTLTPLTAVIVGAGMFLVSMMCAKWVMGLAPSGPALLAVTCALCFVAAACVAAGLKLSKFSVTHPQVDTIAFAENLDTGNAAWVSFDDALDAWTSRFVARQSKVPADLLSGARASVLWKAALMVQAKGPQLMCVSHTESSSTRQLQLLLVPQGAGDRLELSWDIAGSAEALAVQDRPVNLMVGNHDAGNLGLQRTPRQLYYFGAPADGVKVVMTLPAGRTVTFHLLEYVPGIPAGLGPPGLSTRPASFAPGLGSDFTYLLRSYTY